MQSRSGKRRVGEGLDLPEVSTLRSDELLRRRRIYHSITSGVVALCCSLFMAMYRACELLLTQMENHSPGPAVEQEVGRLL